MNFAAVEKIANAVLYEGYMLYPYRPSSTKNKQRWNFGTLYPQSYAAAQRPAEPYAFTTELLLIAQANAIVELRLRCLQLLSRDGGAWEEGVEHSAAPTIPIADALSVFKSFDFALNKNSPLAARMNIQARLLSNNLYKLIIEVQNTTDSDAADREQALRSSLVSAHLLVAAEDSEFVSSLDPPEQYRAAVAECKSVGVFPVLVGDEQRRDMVLCSPIILYDFPQVAPESNGDFFDGTEMDEMLALRVLTLTEEEKREMRTADDRGRALLERTESLPQEHLMKVHGAIRGMRRVQEGKENDGR